MSAPTIDVEVSRVIAATPETLYDLITDLPTMGAYSPETTAVSWLDGHRSATVGARFRGANAIGSVRWTTKPVVTIAERGRRFAFRVPSGARSTWAYQFEAVEHGTRVTESIHTERSNPAVIRVFMRMAGVRDRPEHLRTGMTTTLARLDAAAVAAESGAHTH
jgi:uncharacterized protein YndB with AHSA1/START domain